MNANASPQPGNVASPDDQAMKLGFRLESQSLPGQERMDREEIEDKMDKAYTLSFLLALLRR